jgi:arylsulfatase A-like enzyme
VEPDPAGFEAWRAALPAAVQTEVDFEDYAWVLRETAAYDAEVAGVDAALGQLFDWLDARGEADDTVVVVTADHGEGLWQRPLPVGERAQPHNRVKQLYADHGIQLFDEQVHVPLVLLGPGLGEPRRVATPVSLVDVAPTLYELADLAPPEAGERLSGLSLLGDLDARSELYAFCSRGSSLTVGGRWRLQLPADHRAAEFGLEPELFDLKADPGEVAPVTGDPEADARRASLAERLRAFRELYAPAGALSEEEAALRRELLDAMGYTGQ